MDGRRSTGRRAAAEEMAHIKGEKPGANRHDFEQEDSYNLFGSPQFYKFMYQRIWNAIEWRVFAEIACAFASEQGARDAMRCLGVEFESCSLDTALACGEAFRVYRVRGGRRERVIADFLIGAHAQKHADRLLTRDRGFQRIYFCGLTVIDPSGEL